MDRATPHLIMWQPHHHFTPIGARPHRPANSLHPYLSLTSHQIFIGFQTQQMMAATYVLSFTVYYQLCQDEDGEEEVAEAEQGA